MSNMVNRYKDLYSEYLNTVTSMISRYETLTNAFPIGILNELRAILTHLAKAELSDGDGKEKQVGKAEGHLTRAIRDCYKYNCMAIDDRYKEFMTLEAVPQDERAKIFSAHEKALDLLLAARKAENSVDSDSQAEDICEKYKLAYNAFDAIYSQIREISGTIQ